MPELGLIMETSERVIIIREIVEVEQQIARLHKQQEEAETALRLLRDQLALSNSEATRATKHCVEAPG